MCICFENVSMLYKSKLVAVNVVSLPVWPHTLSHISPHTTLLHWLQPHMPPFCFSRHTFSWECFLHMQFLYLEYVFFQSLIYILQSLLSIPFMWFSFSHPSRMSSLYFTGKPSLTAWKMKTQVEFLCCSLEGV